MGDWKDNPGYCPGAAKGKRVMVELVNGNRPKDSWPADGKGEPNWKVSKPPHPFEIKRYLIV